MFLPVLCYDGSFATLTILMKNSLMENLGRYVRTAYAKGLSEWRVISSTR
jgi:ABC-type microcin C transport system permease subunit YejB